VLLRTGSTPADTSRYGRGVPDITTLILEDHAWFRWQFHALDALQAADAVDAEAVRALWEPLSARLDLHAIAEEKIFYPQLLAVGEDPEAETLDAIGDHNDIRDGLHDANRHPVASDDWWTAVMAAREANDEHMGEEEHEGLRDFRLRAPDALRERLGAEFAAFLDTHTTTRGVDTSDKDPEGYVRDVERELALSGSERELDHPASGATGGGSSLGIGSLKGR
jgi:hypothetical protein